MEKAVFVTCCLAVISSSLACQMNSCSDQVQCELEFTTASCNIHDEFFGRHTRSYNTALYLTHWKDDNYTYVEIEWQAKHEHYIPNLKGFLIVADYYVDRRISQHPEDWTFVAHCFRAVIPENQKNALKAKPLFHISCLRINHEDRVWVDVAVASLSDTHNIYPNTLLIDTLFKIAKEPAWDFKLRRWTDGIGNHHFQIENPYTDCKVYRIRLLEFPQLKKFRENIFHAETLDMVFSNVSRKVYAVLIFALSPPGDQVWTGSRIIYPDRLNFTDTSTEE